MQSNLEDELANGLRAQVHEQHRHRVSGTASTLWGTAPAMECVAVQTGGGGNQVARG